ncbi:hypothetical protein [Winogradskyella haliclonae]|uniref:Uncharacterized protein n=1 Tax=Winogradskyella haliclonae TaxID=2048558 RepID=A0ABQ2BZA9_9FLAO|nr:hypothetical protein [Winogradskyella haliclonae]GGI56892.1 hypothetical protein GCM10011444_12010 [Winogradskyella haliclonae]
MSLTSKLTIPFNAIFPDEEPLEIEGYFEGITRDTLLKIGSFFLGFRANGSDYSHPFDFIRMFFSEENREFARLVRENLIEYVSEERYSVEDYSFSYVVSSLAFFEKAFDLAEDIETTLTNTEIEISVFKAFLLLNQIKNTDSGVIASESTADCVMERKPAAILLSLQLNNFDFTNYQIDKLISTQLIRSISFFEFLESKDSCTPLLNSFYAYYDVGDYKEYLKRLLPLSISIVKRNKEGHTDIELDNDEHLESNVTFLDKISVDESDILEDVDFKKLRANPIYKLSENKYRIISPQFVLETIFNGLYWKFKPINDGLPVGDRINNFLDFKTFEFSEKYVLHKLLREIFGRRFFQRNGTELDALCDGAPDYYVRNGKRMFLFESKDIMLNANVKQSSDFNQIERELKKKLYIKDDGTPKAVVQLIKTIRKALDKTLEYDTGYNPKRVIIFPVLVLHNRMFNVGGFNKLLNFWFQDELQGLRDEGFDTQNVMPLVTVDIDTLIFNKNVFVDRKLKFEDIHTEYSNEFINFSVEGRAYVNEAAANKASKDSYVPFSFYLDNKVDRMNLRTIQNELMEKGYSLLE